MNGECTLVYDAGIDSLKKKICQYTPIEYKLPYNQKAQMTI